MDNRCILVGAAVALLAVLFHKYFIRIYDYWRNRGIPCVEGALPIFGNTLSVTSLRKNFGSYCDEVYNANPNRSMVGFFQFRSPMLLIRDPELVKTVLISGFASFHANTFFVDAKNDPLIAQNPFCTTGDEWKLRRGRLSNVLTSGKKLKILCSAVTRVCAKFTRYLEDNVKASEGSYEFDAKDLFTRFTGEVVASAGFGVEGDFFSNGSGPNSFREVVAGAFEPTLGNGVKFTLLFAFPKLSSYLGLSVITKRMDRFLRSTMSDMIAMREKEGIVRNDFLQIMLDTHKAEGGEIDESATTASATSFFLDGYETSAITLGFLAYHVAADPRVQDRLRREVNSVLDRYSGEITYEAVSEMTYMEQAINESLRLYPSIGFMLKRCTQRCKLVGSDGVECTVEPGTEIVIPSQALHRDPQYWDKPEIYDPDRFGAETKNENRPKIVFLPFGEGPRKCVGMRFGTMQVKAAMATILRRYSVEVSPRTREPIQLEPTSALSAAVGGLWLRIKEL